MQGDVAMQQFNTLAIKEALNPFSFFKGDKESKLGTNSLSFVGKVGKGKNRRLSYWKVKSTGNYGTDLKIGQSYAFEALRVARAQESAGCISLIMQSFPKGEKMTGIEQGFIKVIADCTMAGTMWLAEKSTL